MSDRIYLSSPHMSDEGRELAYIQDAFSKNWIAPLGENVNEFESAVKGYTGAEQAVALSSGSAALHLAMILAGVGPGDLVFCQDLTFSASVNPAVYVGAKPVFIDSERDTWNMDPTALRRAIAHFGIPKAVIAVHLYGNPAKMDEILAVCEEYNIPLIEDAAEALGSICRGRCCGILGTYGILSFNGNKIVTTSGGGMLLCRSEADAAHALKLATQAREPLPWYQHEEIGYNYRMSNICAGIGRGQMEVLGERVRKKRAIYEGYREGLAGLPLSLQPMTEGCESNCWLTALQIHPAVSVCPADVIAVLEKENIESRYLWKPMHSQPVFADAPYVTAGGESVSDDLFRHGVCLPSDTKMSDADLSRVCAIIRSLF